MEDEEILRRLKRNLKEMSTPEINEGRLNESSAKQFTDTMLKSVKTLREARGENSWAEPLYLVLDLAPKQKTWHLAVADICVRLVTVDLQRAENLCEEVRRNGRIAEVHEVPQGMEIEQDEY